VGPIASRKERLTSRGQGITLLSFRGGFIFERRIKRDAAPGGGEIDVGPIIWRPERDTLGPSEKEDKE